jgi:hypothetical protein
VLNYTLTIPANTPASAPVSSRVKISAGILNEILVGFHAGPNHLAHAIIFYQGYQIEPWNRDGSFHGDDYTFDVRCTHEILEPDTEVTLIGWNLDTANAHDVDFSFQVIQPPEATAEQLLEKVAGALGAV